VVWEDETPYPSSGPDRDILFNYKDLTQDSFPLEPSIVSEYSTDSSRNPTLAVDYANRIHVVWEDDTDDEYGSYKKLYYSWSRGDSWGVHEVVSTEGQVDAENPSLVIDKDGMMHIAWHSTYDWDGTTDVDIFYKSAPRMTDNFHSYDTEKISEESTVGGFNPSLDVWNDIVYVVWEDYSDYMGSGDNPSDIYYKRKLSTGWESTEVIAIESSGGATNPSISVDSDDGRVHIVWQDFSDFQGSGGDWDIFYKMHSGNLDLVITSPRYIWQTGSSWIRFNIRNMIPDRFPPVSIMGRGLSDITAEIDQTGVGDVVDRVEFTIMEISDPSYPSISLDDYTVPYEWSNWPADPFSVYLIGAVAYNSLDEPLTGDLVAVLTFWV
jgi:hypothetical protein